MRSEDELLAQCNPIVPEDTVGDQMNEINCDGGHVQLCKLLRRVKPDELYFGRLIRRRLIDTQGSQNTQSWALHQNGNSGTRSKTGPGCH